MYDGRIRSKSQAYTNYLLFRLVLRKILKHQLLESSIRAFCEHTVWWNQLEIRIIAKKIPHYSMSYHKRCLMRLIWVLGAIESSDTLNVVHGFWKVLNRSLSIIWAWDITDVRDGRLRNQRVGKCPRGPWRLSSSLKLQASCTANVNVKPDSISVQWFAVNDITTKTLFSCFNEPFLSHCQVILGKETNGLYRVR